MKIERSFEILELDSSASLSQAKQAYKDIVRVWHPDRFSRNPRLREKAEKKLQEINAAYEQVESFLSSRKETRQSQREKRGEGRSRARTEAAAEAGTRLVLTVCSFLYTKLRGWVNSQVSESGSEPISISSKRDLK